jgi:hypothetical protein
MGEMRARYVRENGSSKSAVQGKLARETTGHLKATYNVKGSRAALQVDPIFSPAFTEAKARVREMDLRFIEEPDALRQTLLEVYVAVVLKTPYNDFDTH